MTSSGVRLRAVGDLQLGDSATCVGFGFRSRVSDGDLTGALLRLGADIEAPEIFFANLETPLSDLGLDRRQPRTRRLRGAPAYAAALQAGGISIVNVANNHSLEHGGAAFQDSVSRLERVGVLVCGLRGSDGWAAKPTIATAAGLRLGFLGYSLRPSPSDQQPLHAEATEQEIVADVRRLRPSVNHVVVSLHWGEEFVEAPSTAEVALAHAIVDAGAIAILGHHPHVVRPAERYRDAVIAYSLGNFAADMIWYAPNRRGLVLDCQIASSGVRDVQLRVVRMASSYLPRLEAGEKPRVVEAVDAVPPNDYIARARDTVRAQRRALYLYTLRNMWRFRPGVLIALATTTLRAKLASRLGGQRDEIWG